MTIRGLPAHVLLVHLVVVLIPLVAAAAIAATVWPAAQRKLTFLIPVGGWAAVLAAGATQVAGASFAHSLDDPAAIDRHAQLGALVLPLTACLAVSTTVQWWWARHGRHGLLAGRLIAAAVLLSSAAAVGIVVLAADAGAQAVWGG